MFRAVGRSPNQPLTVPFVNRSVCEPGLQQKERHRLEG